jgi:hypothetical protein
MGAGFQQAMANVDAVRLESGLIHADTANKLAPVRQASACLALAHVKCKLNRLRPVLPVLRSLLCGHPTPSLRCMQGRELSA